MLRLWQNIWCNKVVKSTWNVPQRTNRLLQLWVLRLQDIQRKACKGPHSVSNHHYEVNFCAVPGIQISFKTHFLVHSFTCSDITIQRSLARRHNSISVSNVERNSKLHLTWSGTWITATLTKDQIQSSSAIFALLSWSRTTATSSTWWILTALVRNVISATNCSPTQMYWKYIREKSTRQKVEQLRVWRTANPINAVDLVDTRKKFCVFGKISP